MARRGWGRSVGIAILAAAGAAAAQAGLGYGLGVISWLPTPGSDASVTESGGWSSSLAWTAFIAATSVVIGAVSAERSSGSVQSGRAVRGLRRLVLSLAATVGGAAIIPLAGVPAQFARVSGTFAPHILVGVYAAVGVVAGLVVALIATSVRAVAANLYATAAWLWILAVIVIVHRSVTGKPLSYVPLAEWKFTENGPVWGSIYLPGAMLMLGAMLLIGGLAAFPAAGRGAGRLGIALSGAVGPLLITGAYLLANPDPAATPFEQVSAAHVAPYLAVAGLAGSGLVALVGGAPKPRRRRKADKKADKQSSAQPPVEPPVEPPPAPYDANTTYSATASVPPNSRAYPA